MSKGERVSTAFLNDKKLTLTAKGLMATIYSLSNNSSCCLDELCEMTNTGITAIRNAMKNLEAEGYISRERTKNEKGQFQYILKINK